MNQDVAASPMFRPAHPDGPPIRVGLVGANPERGWGSGVHRRVIERLPGFELSAVCTTRRESAEAAKDLFAARHAFTDAAELAAHPDVDLVSICVLAPDHHAIARAALEAGKHVYCEWPLALAQGEADELAALAVARGVKAMIGLHLRGAPALRYAADLIGEGFIGRLTDVNLHSRLPGSIVRTMAQRAGGTTLISIYGGHLMDAVGHYFGPVADWSARAAIHLPPVDELGRPVERDAPDHVLIQGALASGALFSVDLNGGAPAALGSTWRIGGTEGVLALSSAAPDMPAMEALSVSGARAGEPLRPMPIPARYDCAAIPAQPARYSAYPGVDASRAALVSIGVLYTQLAQAIREDGPVTPDFSRAAEVQRFVATIDAAVSGADGSTTERRSRP